MNDLIKLNQIGKECTDFLLDVKEQNTSKMNEPWVLTSWIIRVIVHLVSEFWILVNVNKVKHMVSYGPHP